MLAGIAFRRPVYHNVFCRRKVLLANSITGLAASLTLSLSYVAFSYELLIVGRLIAGFHAGTFPAWFSKYLHTFAFLTGISSAVGPMYMTEIPPKDVRGIFGGSYECFHVLAILISEVLGHPSVLGTATLWPYLFALGAVPCILQLATLPFCPESPKYLYLAKNQPDKAKEGRSLPVVDSSDSKATVSATSTIAAEGRNESIPSDSSCVIFLVCFSVLISSCKLVRF